MTKTKAYSIVYNSGRMHVSLTRYLFIFLFLLTFTVGITSFAQEETPYDEISVFLNVPNVGSGEIDAVIKGSEVYLPVTDLFDFLKIRNTPSSGLETITGFFINQEATYSIDRVKNQIQYGTEIFKLEPGDLIRTETNLFLRSLFFGRVFGLDCVFDFRNLAVTVNTRLELPVMREMRLEKMRQNLTRLKGEVKADTTIGRSYPMFDFGMADWSVIATEQINGQAEARLNLTLGAVIAGGETTVSLNYNSREPFTEKQQYYLWRRVNNNNKAMRQVMAGKFFTHATSTIYDPVVGVQVTNTPTTFRKSFGSYTLNDKTEPGWIVELYVNNVLVDFVKADAAGFFSFQVPLVYGNSLVRLKFYGPWGEERVSERNISIPFSFLPKNKLEYYANAGIVEDTLFSRFSRSSVNYGLTRGITIGAGYEYLSSVTSGPMMPFANASFRLASNLLLSAEYTHGVRAKGSLSYRLRSNIQFDLNYIKYVKGQTAINFNYLEERKIAISVPIRIKKFSAYTRLTLNQLVLPSSLYTTGEWLLSSSFWGVNTNLTTYALFIGNTAPTVYSNLSLSFRMPGEFTLTPQVQYGFTEKKLLTAKLRLEKRVIQRGYLNLSYEQNFASNFYVGELGFRYDFKFAQTGFSTRHTNRYTTLVQHARGSFINDRKTRYHTTDNRANVGKGGITVLPFIDINANGTRDAGEPKAYGLSLRASGGRIVRSEKDTTIRILNLEPYADCFIELDQSGFDNISWTLKNKTMSVAVDPNMLKLIEIPIYVIGEASGMVTIDKGEGEPLGLARVIVNFYNSDQKLSGRTLTEQDGYFSYFGLAPGAFTVRIDTAQMRKLSMVSTPDSINFDITANIEGDFIDGLDFTVTVKPENNLDTPEKKVTRRDTTYVVVHEVVQEVTTSSTDSYIIQLGAFKRKSNANAYRKKLAALLGREVEIIIENGFYKVRIMGFETREEVDNFITILHKNGVNELWVITLKGVKKYMVIRTVHDTIHGQIETLADGQSRIMYENLAIQVGEFKDSTDAEAYRRRVSAAIDRPVIVVFEDGSYKVRITRFFSRKERERIVPFLNLMGFNNIWLMPSEELPEQPTEEPVINPAIKKVDIDSVKAKTIDNAVLPETKIKDHEQAEPTFYLQVAVYTKLKQAEKAQRKIIEKLNLPVEILQQYGNFSVIITGFYTREESYKYYPELAGLGFTAIYLLEKGK
jgi:cell division protein FtsN